MSHFPIRRLRRLRNTHAMRSLTTETRLHIQDFVYPIFVVEDPSAAGPIPSMPGISRYSLTQLPAAIDAIAQAGIQAILLFGIPATKDQTGAIASDPDGIVPQAIRSIRATYQDVAIMTDICLCSYLTHGHCGVIPTSTDATSCAAHGPDNDRTLAILGKMATAHARAGADVVAPSGMMDGMVGAIRAALDESSCQHTAIMSYSVKYASSFYGPFRDAADSTPQHGTRQSYQMNPANTQEALAEAQLDVQEGADILMVKPAMPYLDVIQQVKSSFPYHPLAAYQVSGEYSMIKAAALEGWLDEERVMVESLMAIKRAGADIIISYFAPAVAKFL